MEGLAAIFVVLVLVTSPFWAIPLKRWVEHWLVRKLEDRVFHRAAASNVVDEPIVRPGPPLFPFASALAVLYVALAAFARAPLLVGAPYLLLFAAVLVLAGFGLHVWGRIARRWKYDFVLGALVLLFAAGLRPNLAGPLSMVTQNGPNESAGSHFAIAKSLGWAASFLVAQVVAFAIARRIDFSRAVLLFHYLQMQGVWLLAVLVTPFLVLWCLVRYHVVAILAQRPILYFRSFQYADAPVVFADVVVEACRRFGVIEGLVHPSQRASDLQSKLDVSDQAHLVTVPAEQWQAWVLSRLRRASAVIVDATLASNNVTWEIDRAIDAVGPDRVIVIFGTTNAPRLPDGVQSVSYTMERDGLKQCARELTTWLGRRFRSNDPVSPIPAGEDVPDAPFN